MLERFDLLKNSVKKALIDLNNPVQFEESDFQLINEIIKVLAPVKLSVEALCRSDANLCTADATLRFLFQQLRENDSILASKMKTHLLNRMKDRRQNELSGVLNYLQNPHTEKTETTESNNLDTDCDVKGLFSSPSKMAIKKQIISLTARMENNDNEEIDMKIEPVHTTSKTDLTLKEKLQNEIENSMKTINPEVYKETDLSKIIKQEMNLYENSSSRGCNLEKTYKNLLTIPPTSIEPERAFSASSYLCNKLRSMLSDETLDALLFLRFYFRGLNK